jgi:hypothetical protein
MYTDTLTGLCGEFEKNAICAAVEADVVLRYRSNRLAWPPPHDALHAVLDGDLSGFAWAPTNGSDLVEFIARYAPSDLFQTVVNLPDWQFEALRGSWDTESPLHPLFRDMVAAATKGAIRAYRALLAVEGGPANAEGPEPHEAPPGTATQMLDHEPNVAKRRLLEGLQRLSSGRRVDRDEDLLSLYAERATIHGSHPIGTLIGVEQINGAFWIPLRDAMPNMTRRDDILMGGRSGERDWVAATGYYVGTMVRPLWGLRPIGLLRLRFGEFHEISRGRIVSTHVILDLVDALEQAGCNPLGTRRGAGGHCPGPMTQDGLLLHDQKGSKPWQNRLKVKRFLEQQAHLFEIQARPTGNPHDVCGDSKSEQFALEGAMFHGCGGIGTRYHRECYLARGDFAGWATPGQLRANFGTIVLADGKYVAAAGGHAMPWADMVRESFNFSGDKEAIELRAMQWWRIEDSRVVEGWAVADLLGLHHQRGRDVWAEGIALQKDRQRPSAKLPPT